MKTKKTISIENLKQSIDSKNQITSKDLISIKGGQGDPPPWGNFTGG